MWNVLRSISRTVRRSFFRGTPNTSRTVVATPLLPAILIWRPSEARRRSPTERVERSEKRRWAARVDRDRGHAHTKQHLPSSAHTQRAHTHTHYTQTHTHTAYQEGDHEPGDEEDADIDKEPPVGDAFPVFRGADERAERLEAALELGGSDAQTNGDSAENGEVALCAGRGPCVAAHTTERGVTLRCAASTRENHGRCGRMSACC